MRLLLALCLLTSPASAQLSASASLVGMVHTSVGWGQSRDRETFGIRYRTPGVKGVTLQAGYTMTAENGIVFPTAAGLRHFAGAAEYAVTPWWRAQGIYGILLEFRDAERSGAGVPLSTYYRLWAVGNEFHRGPAALTVERLVWSPRATHAALHHWVVRGRLPNADLLVKQVGQSPNSRVPFRFWAVEATVRPLSTLPEPFRWVGIQGGTRPMLDPSADRSRPMAFVAAGLFYVWRNE